MQERAQIQNPKILFPKREHCNGSSSKCGSRNVTTQTWRARKKQPSYCNKAKHMIDPALMERRQACAKRLELYRNARDEIDSVAWAKWSSGIAPRSWAVYASLGPWSVINLSTEFLDREVDICRDIDETILKQDFRRTVLAFLTDWTLSGIQLSGLIV